MTIKIRIKNRSNFNDTTVSSFEENAKQRLIFACLFLSLPLLLLGFGVISTPAIEDAFRRVDRAFFVPAVGLIGSAARANRNC